MELIIWTLCACVKTVSAQSLLNLHEPTRKHFVSITMNSIRFSDPRDPADVTAARRFEVDQIKLWVADYLNTRTVRDV